MTAPPWGHKPPAVDDSYRYWSSPPPEPSPRVAYWLRRMDEGSWHLTAQLGGNGRDFMAEWLGVYMWEWLEVIWPAAAEMFAAGDIAGTPRDRVNDKPRRTRRLVSIGGLDLIVADGGGRPSR